VGRRATSGACLGGFIRMRGFRGWARNCHRLDRHLASFETAAVAASSG
jgi:hypothetical protein